jgi:hypothetical protein
VPGCEGATASARQKLVPPERSNRVQVRPLSRETETLKA